MSKLTRVKGAAEFLGVSKSQIWKLTADGTLKSYKLSDRVTVWKFEELEQFIALRIGA